MSRARWIVRSVFVLGALGAVAGCGREPLPTVPVAFTEYYEISCAAGADVCTGGRDMLGMCVAPMREDPYTPPELMGRTPCGRRVLVDGAPFPDEATQGARECNRIYCGCEGGSCEDCTAAFGGYSTTRCTPDHTPAPRPPVIVRPDAGVPIDAAGMDGGTPIEPPPTRHQVLSYEWTGGPIPSEPTFRYDLDPPFDPPAAMKVQGRQLWMLASDGTLASFDVTGTRLRRFSLGLTNAVTFDFVERPLHPGTWVLVGAMDGVRLYELVGSDAIERAFAAGMAVRDVAPHSLEALRDDAWVSFVSTMPDTIWVHRSIDGTIPGSRAIPQPLSFQPVALSVEAVVDPARMWPAGLSAGRGVAQAWNSGTVLPLDPTPLDMRGAVRAIGGAEYFDDMCIENNTMVVATDTPGAMRVTPYPFGNLRMPGASLDLPGSFVGLEVRHEAQDIVAFALTGSPSTLYALFPHASGVVIEEEQALPSGVLPEIFTIAIDTTPCRLTIRDAGPRPDGGTSGGGPRRPPSSRSVFFHVVVQVL